ATGNTPESVDFTLPAGMAPGACLVSAIANGIASDAVLTIQISPDSTDLLLRVDPTNPANVEVSNHDTLLGSFPISSFGSIIVTGSNTDSTITISATFPGVPVTINEGTGLSHIFLGDGNLDSIQGPVIIYG